MLPFRSMFSCKTEYQVLVVHLVLQFVVSVEELPFLKITVCDIGKQEGLLTPLLLMNLCVLCIVKQ